MNVDLDQARLRAAALGLALEPGHRETVRGWYFPVEQPGCLGVVVDKQDGGCIRLGSLGTLDDWLWGYDKGLLEEGGIALVLTEVLDEARAIDGLARVGLRLSHAALQHLPQRLDAHGISARLHELRAVDETIARWHVQAPRGSVRPPPVASAPPTPPAWNDEQARKLLGDLVAWWSKAPTARDMAHALAPSFVHAGGGLLERRDEFAARPTGAHQGLVVRELHAHGPAGLAVFDATSAVTDERRRHHWIVTLLAPDLVSNVTTFSRVLQPSET